MHSKLRPSACRLRYRSPSTPHRQHGQQYYFNQGCCTLNSNTYQPPPHPLPTPTSSYLALTQHHMTNPNPNHMPRSTSLNTSFHAFKRGSGKSSVYHTTRPHPQAACCCWAMRALCGRGGPGEQHLQANVQRHAWNRTGQGRRGRHQPRIDYAAWLQERVLRGLGGSQCLGAQGLGRWRSEGRRMVEGRVVVAQDRQRRRPWDWVKP